MMPIIKNVRILLAVGSLALLLVGAYVLLHGAPEPLPTPEPIAEQAETVQETEMPYRTEVIGTSVEERPIEVYSFGTGDREVLLVGGIHGGYEWNSSLLAYEYIDYLITNREVVPEGTVISVIPVLNPDGLAQVVGTSSRFTRADVPTNRGPLGTGRFNARGVDLNRNFDCKWEPESNWRGTTVSAGSAPFSEPEAQALRDYVLTNRPVAVAFWHSQANAVYASECEQGILAETRSAMNAYANAARYPSVDVFDAYPVTGDAEGWLASIGIPAITVELSTHETIEWERNLAGTKALVEHFSSNLAR